MHTFPCLSSPNSVPKTGKLPSPVSNPMTITQLPPDTPLNGGDHGNPPTGDSRPMCLPAATELANHPAEGGDKALELLKAVAQAWHGHSGNPRPAKESDALQTWKSVGASRFRAEAARRAEMEARMRWDFRQSLWDSYEIVTISKKLESSMALDHPLEPDEAGKRSGRGKRGRLESRNSLRKLLLRT